MNNLNLIQLSKIYTQNFYIFPLILLFVPVTFVNVKKWSKENFPQTYPAPAKSLPKSKNINSTKVSTISNITSNQTKPSIVSKKPSPFEVKPQQPKLNKMITQESNLY